MTGSGRVVCIQVATPVVDAVDEDIVLCTVGVSARKQYGRQYVFHRVCDSSRSRDSLAQVAMEAVNAVYLVHSCSSLTWRHY